MQKSDFTKGQTVYLYIIENSNAHRYIKNKPFSERIIPATVKSVGKKYITVSDFHGYYDVAKFDINNDFWQSVDYGSPDYHLFLSEQDVYDYVKSEEIYASIRDVFNSYKNQGKLTLKQLEEIKRILEEK